MHPFVLRFFPYVLSLFALLPVLALLLGSCDGTSDEASGEALVVEGWIANGEYPVVMVSTTVPVSEQEQDTRSLSDHVDHWARVTIDDGSRTVTLMGMYDKRYMPPYIYTTTDMTGRVGATYRLTVESGGRRAEAVTTIPAPVALDTIERETSPDQPLGHQFYAVFRNPGGQGRYVLFYMVGRKAQQPALSTMGIFDNTMIGEGVVRYPVNISDNLVEDRRDSLFDERPQYLCVRLATIDAAAYSFWRSFQDTYTMSGNFLMPYTRPLAGNVAGAYGCWCGMGVSEKWAVVSE